MRTGQRIAAVALVTLLAGCSGSTGGSTDAPRAIDASADTADPGTTTIQDTSPATTTTTATATATADTTPLPAAEERNESGDPLDAPPSLPADKQLLIDSLDPTADCANDTVEPRLQPGPDEAVLQVVRAVGECIVIDSSIVATADLSNATAGAQARTDVISAGEATTAFYDSVVAPPADDPGAADQQWWLNDLDIAGLDALTVDPATSKIRVAVIDSGIDDSNPDLAGTVVLRLPGAVAPGQQTGDDPHGTHVAGIIAAAAGNGIEGRGIARNVEFIDANTNASGYIPNLIEWSVNHGADVINMSFCEVAPNGEPPCRDQPTGATAAAIAYARSRGVLVFAAAGNCGGGNFNEKREAQCAGVQDRVTYPAAYDGVISVAAYSADGTVAAFSTQNDYVDVSAPGDGIYSTVFGGQMAPMNGTSQASPMVTGAAVALLAHRPDLVPGRILSGLFAIARHAGNPGWNKQYGNGKIWPVEVARLLDERSPPGSATATPPVSNTPVTFVDEPETGPLLLGHHGVRVAALQGLLRVVGKLADPPDLYFGHGTENAVRAFQRDANLVADGIAGTATMHALDVAAGGAPFATMRDADAAVLVYLAGENSLPATGWLAFDLDSARLEPSDFAWRGAGYGGGPYPTELDYYLTDLVDGGGVFTVLVITFKKYDGVFWYNGIKSFYGH